MLVSEAIGRNVLSTDTAESVGTVTALLVDPVSARIAVIRLKKTPGSGDTLHWPDLTSFGADNVTVPSAAVITQATAGVKDLDSKAGQMIGKRVLTDAGTEIGAVDDIEFDPASGAVVALQTTSGPVYGDRLIGCGSYAVVLSVSSGAAGLRV